MKKFIYTFVCLSPFFLHADRKILVQNLTQFKCTLRVIFDEQHQVNRVLHTVERRWIPRARTVKNLNVKPHGYFIIDHQRQFPKGKLTLSAFGQMKNNQCRIKTEHLGGNASVISIMHPTR